MKQQLILCMLLLALFTSCKKEEVTEYLVYWNTTTINNSNPVNQEMEQIYTAFDNALANASSGNVQNHSIFISSIPLKQVSTFSSEMKRLAAQADESLQNFSPTSYYTVTLTTSLGGKTETLATYYYGPKDQEGQGDNDENGDENEDGNDDGDEGSGDEYIGDGIVDEMSVYALKPSFYAPLTNDLIDYVSGIAGTLYGNIGTFSEQGLTFNHNRIVWTSGRWNNISYNTPFTILADYTRTGSNNEHMHIVNTSPGPGVNVERGIDICCRNGSQNNLITGLSKTFVFYGITSVNTCLINEHHILTGYIYDGNGLITRVQDGVITDETYTISPNNFPDFAGTFFCIGGLHNYNKDYWVGTIGNVMFFERALSQHDITSMQ